MFASDSENKPIIVLLALLGVLLAAYLFHLFSSSERPEAIATESVDLVLPKSVDSDLSSPVKTPAPNALAPNALKKPAEKIAHPAPVPEDIEPAFILPRLDNSDQLVRDGVVSLTRDEDINAWLSPDELIRKIIVFVDNIANGNIGKEAGRTLAPKGKFLVIKLSEESYVIDESAYARYDVMTNIFESIDAVRAVEFYILLKPLFYEAYRELGYPDSSFDEAIFGAIDHILAAPILRGPVKLVRPVVMYRYADKKIESLSRAQKQVLRLGPENTRVIQAKLREFSAALRSAL